MLPVTLTKDTQEARYGLYVITRCLPTVCLSDGFG